MNEPSEASKRLTTYALLGATVKPPPGPPGPPRHTHDDGTTCQYARRGGIDRWRQVDATGWDQGPCPGFDGDTDGGPMTATRHSA